MDPIQQVCLFWQIFSFSKDHNVANVFHRQLFVLCICRSRQGECNLLSLKPDFVTSIPCSARVCNASSNATRNLVPSPVGKYDLLHSSCCCHHNLGRISSDHIFSHTPSLPRLTHVSIQTDADHHGRDNSSQKCQTSRMILFFTPFFRSKRTRVALVDLLHCNRALLPPSCTSVTTCSLKPERNTNASGFGKSSAKCAGQTNFAAGFCQFCETDYLHMRRARKRKWVMFSFGCFMYE